MSSASPGSAGKVGYSSKAEHDFSRPEDFDPRAYATRTDWQLGDISGRARIHLSDRIDWLALRHFGHAGEVTEAEGGGVTFETDYADSRQMVSWVLGLGEQARIEGPDELAAEARERLELVIERHAQPPELAKATRKRRAAQSEEDDDGRDSPIRPERFARLVTLAGILIDAAREGRKLELAELCASLQVSDTELRQDIDVLNVVNFGGGSLRALRRGAGGPDRGRPRALRRQLRAPRPPAAARGQGAGGGDRPDRGAPARGLPRQRAPEDRGRARPGPGRGGPPDHDSEG